MYILKIFTIGVHTSCAHDPQTTYLNRDRGGGGAGRAAAPPLFCAPAPTFCAKKKNN